MISMQKDKLPAPVYPGHEDWVRLYEQAWACAFQNVAEIPLPGWKPQLTCMPGVPVIWQWDSCFMTFITNYANGTLSALNNLDNLYRLRRKSDGYMSMAYEIDTEQPAYGERINPPLMAWAEWEHYRVTGDNSRLAQVLPALEGCYQFIEANRRRSCGLYWFEDSGSSGMDNSPRSGYFAAHLDGSDVCHVDLACQQALSARCIAEIYGLLGDPEKQAFYKAEQARICDLINRYHWSEKTGWYYDFFARDLPDQKVKLINSKTAAAFWTILCGAARGERLERVIAHLFDPAEFYTEVPFASLSRDDLNYDPTGGYWLGGVWAPTNYAVIRGLQEAGHTALAREAAIRYLNAILAVSNDPAYGSIWESYAPEAARPATREEGDLVRTDFVGWSGLAPITMLIETIMGLTFSAPDRTVRFDLTPGEPCGLKNLQFCGGRLDVVCTACGPNPGDCRIEADTQIPIKLIVTAGPDARTQSFDLPVGRSVLTV